MQGTAGTYSFTFENLGWSAGTTYNLISYQDNFITVGNFTFTNGGGFDGYFTDDTTNNVVKFTITAVPEPSTWLLAGAAAAAFGLLTLRARCRAARISSSRGAHED